MKSHLNRDMQDPQLTAEMVEVGNRFRLLKQDDGVKTFSSAIRNANFVEMNRDVALANACDAMADQTGTAIARYLDKVTGAQKTQKSEKFQRLIASANLIERVLGVKDE